MGSGFHASSTEGAPASWKTDGWNWRRVLRITEAWISALFTAPGIVTSSGILADDDPVVDQGGQHTADDRANPVAVVNLPMAADEGRSEGAGRVHAGAGEGPGAENVMSLIHI